MKKIPELKILLGTVLLVAALVALAVVPVMAGMWICPVGGDVILNGVQAPENTTVDVYVGDETTARASTTVAADGTYFVQITGTEADENKPLSFVVAGLPATPSIAAVFQLQYQEVGLNAGAGVAEPDISVPTSLNFGNVVVDSSKDKTLTISNEGDAVLTITSIDVTGTQFSVGAFPGTIAASSSADVTVTFEPTSSGTKSATLTVSSNDPDEPEAEVSLSGTGVTEEVVPGFAGWLYETFIEPLTE